MVEFNVWMPMNSGSTLTIEANIANNGIVHCTGYAGEYFNIFGSLPEELLKNLESYQEKYGFLVSRGIETPEYVVESVEHSDRYPDYKMS